MPGSVAEAVGSVAVVGALLVPVSGGIVIDFPFLGPS